ncbi:MAG: hypothetical protein AB7P49_08445 [Bdellovibrionales bacterium]
MQVFVTGLLFTICALATVLTSAFTSQGAIAAAPDRYQNAQQIIDFCQERVVGLAEGARGLLCNEAKTVFCSESGVRAGCDGLSTGNPQTFSLPSGPVTTQNLDAVITSALNFCKQNHHDKANLCCTQENGWEAGCALSQGATKAVSTRRELNATANTNASPNAGAGKPVQATTYGACKQSELVHNLGAQVQAGQGGACVARAEICRVQCGQYAQKILDLCASNGNSSCDRSVAEEKLKPLKEIVSRCANLHPVPSARGVAAELEAIRQAMSCSGASGAAGSTQPQNAGAGKPGDPRTAAGGSGTGATGAETGARPPGGTTPPQPQSGFDATQLLGVAAMLAPSLIQALTGQAEPEEPTYPLPAELVETCQTNPNLEFCAPAATTKVESYNKSSAGADQLDTQSAEGSFNVADTADALQQEIPGPTAQFQSQPAMVGTVPNGGGAIPGAGAAAPASLGGGGGGGGSAPPGTAKKVEFEGERSGGYSQMAAGMTMAPGGPSGFSGYGGGGGSDYDSGFSLPDFLPGGRRDPARSLAGINPRNIQIQSADVNIWARISQRYRSRCNQGLLRDCIP